MADSLVSRVIYQSSIVRLRLLQSQAKRMRFELRQVEDEIRKEKAEITEALMLGAEVENGIHNVWIKQSVKLEVV